MTSRRAWRWRAAYGLALAAACVLAASPAVQAQARQRYTVTINNEVAGALLGESDAQGQVRVDFSYRDNGRGPDLVEHFSLGAFAEPVAYSGSGKSTMGNPIRESYAFDGNGRARWTSLVDRGDKPVEAGALYVPVEGSPLYSAQLVRSLLRHATLTAPSVAGGRFSVERLAQMKLPANGGDVPLVLYALLGVDTTPHYVWLRDDGDKAFFAEVSPWMEVVAAGHEAQGPVLLARQLQAQTERLESLQQRLAQPLPGLTVIRNVRWFDAHTATMRGPADVSIVDGRISAIEAPGSAPAEAAQTIDGSGRTLLPGLYDMHGHMGEEEGLFQLAAGVTSVRDPASHYQKLEALRAKIDAGTIAGPRIQAMGFIEGRSPFSARYDFVIGNLEEGKRAVDWYAERGFIQLKLYNSIKPEWAAPLADYAHAKGLRVGGHVPAFMRAEEAVRAGYDELHHINQVMLNFLVRRDDDTRTLLRFSLVGDKALDIDLEGAPARDFIVLLRERGTVVDLTLAAFEPMYLQRDGQPNPSFGMIASHLPVVAQRELLSASSEINDANAARYAASWHKMLAYAGRLHAAGVPLVAGTDTWAGFGLHRELELYVQAGIPAPQVLRIATLNGAFYTRTLGQRGSIERGKLADLVLVQGDPSVDISAVRKTALVLKGGVAYAPSQIYESLGIRPFVAAADIVANNKPLTR